ncbi:hypothetical protein JW979_03080 [bacterium]|nr:hypothetical protein [candidate division CSSED10-310 bacterium]
MKFSDHFFTIIIGAVIFGGFMLIGQPAIAQDPAAQPPAAQPPADDTTEIKLGDLPRAPVPQAEEKKFTYNPQGTRDPFVSLLVGMDKDVRPPGIAGIKISEVNLIGIQVGLGKTAIITGPDNIAYNMRVGDTVFDGKLVEIEPNKIVFEKIIYDAFGREKEKKQIEKYLHRK